jgi:hypothetical protein
VGGAAGGELSLPSKLLGNAVLGAAGSAYSVGQVLLYMCPHTTIYVSSYYYICVLILRYMCAEMEQPLMHQQCVLILLYMCPHTAIYITQHPSDVKHEYI